MDLFKQTLICAILADGAEGTDSNDGMVTAEDVKIINKLPNPPPVTLKPGDAYARKLRLAGNLVNDYGGCFRDKDLKKLLKLVQGAPLLAGHVKEMIPIGRFFGGEIVEHLGGQFIAPKIYWPKGKSAAEDLRIDIDSGIVNEASISFGFQKPTCSICSEDIRMCDHQVGEEYKPGVCFYWYDNIVRVSEGSLVYRGAEPGTGIQQDNELMAALAAKSENSNINKNGGSDMDLKVLMGNLGLDADTTEDQLKAKLGEGQSAVIDLKTTKATLEAEQVKTTELTAFKASAEPVITTRRTEAERLMNLVYDGKPDQAVQDLLAVAGPEKVEAYIKDWGTKALAMFPMTCTKCGSTDIKGRSSEENLAGGQQPGQVEYTPEQLQAFKVK